MVVLRIVGDEWSWEDRIALAVPPQKAFTMCIPVLVSKLGVEKWGDLVLYRTEGRATEYCRPTVPLNMASNCQRERMRDGTVLWVRAAVSVAQQERDRVFQKSLEDWRARNGIKQILVDGSDVRRFIEELNTRLNTRDAVDLETEERNARDVIEGDEHRCFFFLTSAYCERENLREEEESERVKLETSYIAACERYYREFFYALQHKQITELILFEERNRQALQEEQKGCFVRLAQMALEEIQAIANRSPSKLLDVGPQIDGRLYDTTALLPLVRAEVQKLLEPVEEMLREGFAFFRQLQEAAADDTQRIVAQLQQCLLCVFGVIHGEMWSDNFFPPLQPPGLASFKEMKEALEQQQRLLNELLQGYSDFGARPPDALQAVNVTVSLNAVREAQLNTRRCLDLLQEQLNKAEPPQHGLLEKNIQNCEDVAQPPLKANEQVEPEAKTSLSVNSSAGGHAISQAFVCIDFCGRSAARIHTDVYNILLKFVWQYPEVFSAWMQHSREDLKKLLTDLLHQTGSLHALVDELCWTCNVLSHPMREYFVHAVEYYAPHLSAVVDLMLHLYAGKEVELLLWIRPELRAKGDFVSCVADDGSPYYYHTATDVRQWLKPSSLTGEL